MPSDLTPHALERSQKMVGAAIGLSEDSMNSVIAVGARSDQSSSALNMQPARALISLRIGLSNDRFFAKSFPETSFLKANLYSTVPHNCPENFSDCEFSPPAVRHELVRFSGLWE